jgi:hypothetical protein
MTDPGQNRRPDTGEAAGPTTDELLAKVIGIDLGTTNSANSPTPV